MDGFVTALAESSGDTPPAVPLSGFCRVSFSDDLPGRMCALVEGVEVRPGFWYVVQTPEGQRLGRFLAFEVPVLRPPQGRLAGTLIREANGDELAAREQLRCLERRALLSLREQANLRQLPLQPVAAVALLDRDVVLVSYAAEERLEVRELAREIAQRVHRRVEVRQIGIRDQAKASGGWGPCGRTMCCSTFGPRFGSISIRMAKAQNLPLNPARISGMCGRLMCCLAYEAPEGTHRRRSGGRS